MTDLWTIAFIIGGLVLASAVIVAVRHRSRRKARTAQLREEFRSEYDRVVEEHGRRKGEAILEERRQRIRDAEVSRIRPADRESYTKRWWDLQHCFIDHPREAVRAAEVLLVEVMDERGYPTIDVSDRTAAIALERPDRAVPYHEAHQLFVDIEREADGSRRLEDYRQALLTYRALFEAFLARPKSEQRKRVDSVA